ncbi:MAG: toxin-antitoxin system TumE family protein, partial [Candidatus Binatia bacterium]
AERILWEKVIDEDGNITELAISRVVVSAKQPAGVKYRLAFIKRDAADPAVLYDNHHPKGHHRHVAGVEEPYDFTGVDKLLSDFQDDVERIKGARR